MVNNILDGKEVSKTLLLKLKEKYEEILKNRDRKASLATILVGNDPSSKIYLKNKEKACSEVGIITNNYIFDENIEETELIEKIEKLNQDENVDGILLQLPLPKKFDELKILSKINPAKDVDGFHPLNIGKLFLKDDGLYPCTPQGILDLLDYYNIPIESKDVVIIGRSNIVGKPMALMMINKSATVQICHSRTKDLKEKVKNADILVVAVGKPKFINSTYVKDGAIIIDVGINRVDKKLYGDVDFEEIEKSDKKIEWITKVPGGVGPMTIYSLIKNILKAFENLQK